MKIVIILCAFAYSASACDICGCSSSLNFNSITPGYNNNLVGLRYNFNHFESSHPGQNSTSYDYYNSIELIGRTTILKKFQVLASLPFHIYQNREENSKIDIKEFGDASLIINRILLDNSDSIKKLKYFSTIGFGTKFPTGKYQLIQNYSTVNPGLQPGTGSFDFIIQSNNSFRIKNWGNQLDLGYRYNTENSNNYQFGNQFSINYRLFYWFNLKKRSILPHIGLDGEFKMPNKLFDKEIALTGSKIFLANIGGQIFWEHFSLNLQFQKPIYQYINEGNTQNIVRFNSQIIYLF